MAEQLSRPVHSWKEFVPEAFELQVPGYAIPMPQEPPAHADITVELKLRTSAVRIKPIAGTNNATVNVTASVIGHKVKKIEEHEAPLELPLDDDDKPGNVRDIGGKVVRGPEE